MVECHEAWLGMNRSPSSKLTSCLPPSRGRPSIRRRGAALTLALTQRPTIALHLTIFTRNNQLHNLPFPLPTFLSRRRMRLHNHLPVHNLHTSLRLDLPILQILQEPQPVLQLRPPRVRRPRRPSEQRFQVRAEEYVRRDDHDQAQCVLQVGACEVWRRGDREQVCLNCRGEVVEDLRQKERDCFFERLERCGECRGEERCAVAGARHCGCLLCLLLRDRRGGKVTGNTRSQFRGVCVSAEAASTQVLNSPRGCRLSEKVQMEKSNSCVLRMIFVGLEDHLIMIGWQCYFSWNRSARGISSSYILTTEYVTKL
jgi:hypothetical protein